MASLSTTTTTTTTTTTAEMLRQIEIPAELRSLPLEAAKYQMDELRKKTQELTGVKVPSFYSTQAAINPLLYAEQQKKRKLLWSSSSSNNNVTTTTKTSNDTTTSTSLVGRSILHTSKDEKTAEKFRKLMGIKSTSTATTNGNDLVALEQVQQRQSKVFDYMDKEYEYARQTTHLNRGKGLGFATYASSLLLDPNQQQQQQQQNQTQ
jgi:hypothetical protein